MECLRESSELCVVMRDYSTIPNQQVIAQAVKLQRTYSVHGDISYILYGRVQVLRIWRLYLSQHKLQDDGWNPVCVPNLSLITDLFLTRALFCLARHLPSADLQLQILEFLF